MKIVIVGPAHPYRGGIAKFNEVLAENFIKQGHQVTIANFTLQYPSFLFPGKSQYADEPAPDELNIIRIISSVNPFSWFSAARKIRSEKPDLVILRYWMPFFAPALGTIARQLKCKVIALVDNIVPHEGHLYDKPFTRYFLGGVDGVVYMSRQVGAELEGFRFKGLKRFSPHPIYDTYGEVVTKQEAYRELGLDPACRYSLFFGFIRDYKGLDLLLEAWAKLQEPDLKLIVAGEYYGNKERYDMLIESLGIAHRVIVCDQYIAQDQVRYYFCAADMVIQPYKTATQSGVTQIAYHFGTPMVVTNVGGLAEIVPDGVVGYVVGQSSDEIVAAIEDFYGNNREEEFRFNIQQEKKRFEWAKMTESFVNLYEELEDKK